MSERIKDKLEKEYSDFIPEDETTERPEADEQTYRDGSVKNECWAEKEYKDCGYRGTMRGKDDRAELDSERVHKDGLRRSVCG